MPGFFFDRCLLSGCRLEQPRPPPPLRPCVAPSCLWIDVRLKVARVPRLLPHWPRPPSHYCTTHFSHFERHNSGENPHFPQDHFTNNKTAGSCSLTLPASARARGSDLVGAFANTNTEVPAESAAPTNVVPAPPTMPGKAGSQPASPAQTPRSSSFY